jgi:hypothetical protein
LNRKNFLWKLATSGLTPAGMEMPDWLRWYAQYFLSKEDVLAANFREQTLNMVDRFGHSEPLQFILRLGYVSDYLPPVSPRMPVAKILHS